MGRFNVLGKLSATLGCGSLILALLILLAQYGGRSSGGWNLGPSDEFMDSVAAAFAVLGLAGIAYASTLGRAEQNESVGLGLKTPSNKK
jgi:hypothetical protein